jgi:subtilisin-like proprotein convertase family protein
MTLAAAAYAQPTPNADLGTIAPGAVATGTLTGIAPAQVQWIKFTIAGVTRTSGDYLDIDTNGGTLTGGDSMIGLYDNSGNRIATNDDSGPGAYSMLSFGATTPSRPGLAATGNAGSVGSTHAGANGANLAAGTYWLAVTGFSATFGTTGWTITTSHTRSGDVAYRLAYVYTPPGNPVGSGGFSPAAVRSCDGGSVLTTVSVTPGANPASTGIRVKGDFSSLGGASLQDMFDNGTNGDVTAGDNIYSYAINVASGTAVGNYTFGFTVSDEQGRGTTGTSTGLAVNQCPQPNNAGCGAAEVLSVGVATPGSLVAAGSATAIPACGPYVAGSFNQNWYSFTGTGNTMTLTTCNEVGFDTIIGVFCGVDGCGALTCVGANDDAACSFSGLRSSLSFCSVAGAPYYAIVRGFGTAVGNYVVTVNDDGAPCNATIACGQPTNPTGVGSLGGAVQNCGDLNALVRVTVTPGAFPVSTGISVIADASGLGGSATLALNDAGTDGDVTAGDNIFSANVVVSYTVDAGVPIAVPFTVSDGEGRSSQGSFNATVAECTSVGACCLPTGCERLSRVACETGGGSYLGTNTFCDIITYDQSYASADSFPIAIPDSVGGTPGEPASASVSTAGAGGFAQHIRVCVGLSHTWSGDLVGVLSNGTNSAILINRQGTSTDLSGTYCFASDGTVTFSGGPAGSASYVPFESFSIFASDPADGVWTVTFADYVGADVGSIDSLNIEFGTAASACSTCPPCAADFNSDGGVDGGDIESFFPAWEASDGCADVNLDGGVDGGDIESFFAVWELGGC